MCFNYSINKDPEYLERRFDVKFMDDFDKVYHTSAFENPSLPVITDKKPGRFSFLGWGLVPYWTKGKEQAEDIRMKTGNARADTLFQKPSFRVPIKKRRCLVIADGFFEWREVKGRNYPYYIKMKDDDAFAFAGIWDEWSDKKAGDKLRTFSLITTEANPLLEKVHNKKKRMPAILRRADEKRWLRDGMSEEDIASLLKPYEEKELVAYPIKRLITKKGIDANTPEVLEKYDYDELSGLDEEDETEQTTLF
ncbi:MAG: SOS response-associated peptidase [Thermoplasmatota archaeon]